MTAADELTRKTLATASIILDQGQLADRLSHGLTIASLAGVIAFAVTATHFAALPMLLLGVASLAGLVELWFAARVATDAALFRQLSAVNDSPDWALLDAALTELRLLPEGKAGRPAAPRIAGACRLLRLQIFALIAQFTLIVAGAVAGAVR